MSELIQPVKNGEIVDTKSTTSTSSTSSSSTAKNQLGKDAFLQLLVTQMQYQDPLNPNTDTDYIAQLAQFSQLEQLQNLSASAQNTQAYSLVGKSVVLKTDESKYVTGNVDYVYTSGTKTKLSVNGTLYDYSQLDTVYDEDYLAEQDLPSVEKDTKLAYDANKPGNVTFNVDLGAGETIADSVSISIGDKAVDASLVKLSGNKVTINASAFKELTNGTYKVTVGFDDSLKTTVKDKVTLEVSNQVISNTAS